MSLESPDVGVSEPEAQVPSEVPPKPFDARSEVSADARFIVRRLVLWLLGVPLLICIAIYINYAIAEAQKATAAAAEAHQQFDRTLDEMGTNVAGRLLTAEITACKSKTEGSATTRCIEKAVQACKATKLADDSNSFLLDAQCSR